VTGSAPWAGVTPLSAWKLDALDEPRRDTGRVLDTMGGAPRTSPSTVTAPASGVHLRSYPGADPNDPPVLLVPAPNMSASDRSSPTAARR
jgi:hypothetical protein